MDVGSGKVSTLPVFLIVDGFMLHVKPTFWRYANSDFLGRLSAFVNKAGLW